MKKKRNIWTAFFISLAAIIITYFFINPVLDTQDDVFAEYMLGKGFSAATIPTTYFDHGFLFYEKIFTWLYQSFDSINWITGFYILLHLIAGTFILYIFFKKPGRLFNILIAAAYVCMFFIPFITRLSYTTAAAHCIVSCLFVFIDSVFENQKPSLKKIVILFIVLFLSAGLRANILLPILIIILPFFFLLRKQYLIKWSMTFGGVILVTAVAFFIHENDYEKRIPNHNEIKQVMNAYYELNNYGYDNNKIITEKNSFKKAAFEMVSSNFIYDDTLLSSAFLDNMKTSTAVKITGNKKEVYWLFTDIKQYLIILATAVLYLLFFFKDKKRKPVIFCSNIITAMVSAYLILFMRLPERIWLPVLLLIFLIDLHTIRQLKWNEFFKSAANIFIIIAAISFMIQCRRLRDIKIQNEKGINDFICANNILKQHSQNLFIEYSNGFPFNNFPALRLPSHYSFSNILFPFFFNTELRSRTLQQFGIDDINGAICSSAKIIIVGKADASLATYIYQTRHKKISFIKISSPASCIQLYKVNVVK